MAAHNGAATRLLRIIAWLTVAAAVILAVAGISVWNMVTTNLSAQHITVSEDSPMFPGAAVNGPLKAYAQAQVIEQHALHSTEGKTYAQLAQDDPLRATAMNASFLRASLFTSVVSYGVAGMAVGLAVVFGLLGWGLLTVARSLDGPRVAKPASVAKEPVKAQAP